MGLTRPAALTPKHLVDQFVSGERENAIDRWLKTRAEKNQITGASRTFVVCDHERVVAFYSLSSSSVEYTITSGRFRRNMPNPIPVILLGQFAVDRAYQHRGLAGSLVRDALIRSFAISQEVGVVAVLVDALSDELVTFYRRFGFDSISNNEPQTMMVRMKDVAKELS